MPTLDDQLNELVRDICSLDYIKTKSEMRRRIMEVATAYARSIVPGFILVSPGEEIKNIQLIQYMANYNELIQKILDKIDTDEQNV